MTDSLILMTLKPAASVVSSVYLMIGQVPMDLPLPVDKGIAIAVLLWAWLSTKKELANERKRSVKQLAAFNTLVDAINNNTQNKCKTNPSDSSQLLLPHLD